jgi:hypothetical protein
MKKNQKIKAGANILDFSKKELQIGSKCDLQNNNPNS